MENNNQTPNTPIPRFREKTYKLKNGKSHTYYIWDGRGAGMKDVRLGKDRAEALKMWGKCEAGEFPVKKKVDRILKKRIIRNASIKVLREGHRKKYNQEKKNKIWADAPAWIRIMYYGAQGRSKKSGRSFSLTPADMMALIKRANGVCEITSIPFEPVGKKSPFSISIDRIDSSIGYEIGNVRMVCLIANMAMSAWGLSPLLRLSGAVYAKQNIEHEPTAAPTVAPML